MNVNEEYEALLSLRKKGLLPYYGFFSSSISLLFLRKLRKIGGFFGNPAYLGMIEKRSYERAVLKEQLTMMEKRENLDPNSLTCMLPSFASLLSKKNEIWAYLDEDLPIASSEETASLIQKLLEYADKDFSKGLTYTSRLDLINPVRKVLGVKKSETFMDVFAGFYTLGYGINAESYYGFDKDEKALGIAYMAMILLGKGDIRLKKGDVYSLKELPRCDKIFLDASFASTQDGKKSEKLIRLALGSLNPKGTMVVLCNSKLLNGEEFLSFRKELSSGGHLKSVMALPGKDPSRLYLLVLSEKENFEVEFIDASRSEKILKLSEEKEEEAKPRRTSSYRDEIITPRSSFGGFGFFAMPSYLGKPRTEELSLKEKLKKGGCDDFASETLTPEDVQTERNVSLSPSLYCHTSSEEQGTSKGRSLRDIEADLDKEYRKFADLCSYRY